MIWTETRLNKTIMGWIEMVDATPPAEPFIFTGEFVVSSSPLLDGSKKASELTKADKLELLRLFKKEKDTVDRVYDGTPIQPWPPGWEVY